jgi:hypothetical protein
MKKTLEASTKRMRRGTEVEGCNLAKLTARRSLRRLVQDRLSVDSWCCETRTQKMGEIKNKTEELCKQGDTKPNLMFTEDVDKGRTKSMKGVMKAMSCWMTSHAHCNLVCIGTIVA